MERSQQGVKSKMRELKLISNVSWEGAVKQKGVKQGVGVV